MSTKKVRCPKCLGHGEYGGNQWVAETDCNLCGGTGKVTESVSRKWRRKYPTGSYRRVMVRKGSWSTDISI
jgi:DnaJ-class molecular chaperone